MHNRRIESAQGWRPKVTNCCKRVVGKNLVVFAPTKKGSAVISKVEAVFSVLDEEMLAMTEIVWFKMLTRSSSHKRTHLYQLANFKMKLEWCERSTRCSYRWWLMGIPKNWQRSKPKERLMMSKRHYLYSCCFLGSSCFLQLLLSGRQDAQFQALLGNVRNL